MKRENDAVRIAVRFCGGCNPHYDPLTVLRSIEAQIGAPLSFWRHDDLPDICVLLKQCRSDCFSQPEDYARQLTIVVEQPGDVPAAVRRILDRPQAGNPKDNDG